PLTAPERLVKVYDATPKAGFPKNNPAPANFFDHKRENRVFEDMAAGFNNNFNLTGDGTPESVRTYVGTANTFSVLGVKPLLGRDFVADDEAKGDTRVAVLGHGLWQRRYGGDPAVLGSKILVDGRAYAVIGVMPRGFWYPWRDVELWLPIGWTEEEKANRYGHYLHVVARLKPGVTVSEAQANLSTIAARLAREYPDSNRDLGAAAEPLGEVFLADIRPALLALLAAAALVLLLACANVANLLLVRGAHRRSEMALRAALGASRRRVMRQLLTESLLIAVLGGALGILMAAWASRLLLSLVPPLLEGAVELSIDLPVLGCALAGAIVSLLLAGLTPAISATRVNLAAALHSQGSRTVAGGARLRHGLVVGQV
ncbi:MAG: FtsX-like permease family protein, partial [bacterium]|nr:FtsX-like permease family protein [bacterium]